jgi:hypothetical protein
MGLGKAFNPRSQSSRQKKATRSLFLLPRAPYLHIISPSPIHKPPPPLFLPRAVILLESQTPHLRRRRHRQGRIPPPRLWTRVSLRPSPTQLRLHQQQQKSQCISTSMGAQIHTWERHYRTSRRQGTRRGGAGGSLSDQPGSITALACHIPPSPPHLWSTQGPWC